MHAVVSAVMTEYSDDVVAAYCRLKSVSAVARELGVAFETARRRLVAAGVDLAPQGRPSQTASELDVDVLTERYKAGESIAKLAAAFGVNGMTVRQRLIDAGVQLRPRPGWKY